MEKYRVAICIIAFNEEQNIGQLLNKIVMEKLAGSQIFVYTDGSTDKTAEIVDEIEKKHHKQITHIRGQFRYGKHRAYNSLIRRIEGYKYSIFLDADIDIKPSTLKKLIDHLIAHPELAVVAPLLEPQTQGYGWLEEKVSKIYQKVKVHVAKYGRYKYFTGAGMAARTNRLPEIPERSYSDDFYLNLQFKWEEIGICRKAVVGYFMPSSFWGMFWYSYRIGNSLGDVKKKFPHLWEEQVKRIPLFDYAVFGLTRYKFGEFWRQLDGWEKLMFIYTRKVTAAGFYLGFWSERRNPVWESIKETKRSY